MGISLSSNRRRNNNNNNYYHHHQTPPSQLISSSPYPTADPSYSSPPYIYSPPPPPVYHPYTDGGNYSNTTNNNNNNNNGLMVRPNYGGYSHPQQPQLQPQVQPNYNYGWGPPVRPPYMVPVPSVAPPVYVEHNQAKKVKNHVNLHKETLKVEVDKENPDCHLVSFVFDALFDGSITIYYFAKEEPDCKFVPVYPDAFVPFKVPFQKGHGQRFQQPSGTGIDFGFFDYDSLSKPSSGADVYPLVICAETTAPLISIDEHPYDPLSNTVSVPRKQITQAVLGKNNGDPFKVRVMRQILWIDGVRYELREIYGIGESEESFDDTGSGKECVICMTEPKDTAVLPCRHMCLCSECAKALRLQSNKCPVCRQPIEELMEIKVNTSDD
ncbi:putative E3 ubiquitin-protein ligase LUL4 [Bidens hawaiensis]|uniref:putative E3 ubiquitin-protein ligase LUL4 n=1 Tax=Bidens hawaiensis TaxID=980011 RepID=UPI00404B6516